MAYDKNLPTDQTKLRNYPTVLTDNFIAIEEGDITLQHWQINMVERNSVPGPIPNDPTREDDVMILYSKQDSSGETEAFILDDRNPANVIQLTQDGRLGDFSQGISASSIIMDDTNVSFGINQMITATATVASNGSLVNGVNISASARSATGTYTVTVDADVLLNVNYRVIGMVDNQTTDDLRVLQVKVKPTPVGGNTTVIPLRLNGTAGLADDRFDIIIVGGR